MATHRKLTAAERKLAERFLEIEASSARLGSRLLVVLVVGVSGLGCFMAPQAPQVAVFFWCLAAALLLFAYLIRGLANLRVEDRAYRVRGVCSSKFVPKQGTFYLLGRNRVELSPGWESFWVDGAEIEVDVCHIVKANTNVPTITVLLSLPPLSAELPLLAHPGNGWLALNAIALALAFLAGLALLFADSEDRLIAGLGFLLTASAFGVTLVMARRRLHANANALIEWQRRAPAPK